MPFQQGRRDARIGPPFGAALADKILMRDELGLIGSGHRQVMATRADSALVRANSAFSRHEGTNARIGPNGVRASFGLGKNQSTALTYCVWIPSLPSALGWRCKWSFLGSDEIWFWA
jgi:hypothetical protein